MGLDKRWREHVCTSTVETCQLFVFSNTLSSFLKKRYSTSTLTQIKGLIFIFHARFLAKPEDKLAE